MSALSLYVVCNARRQFISAHRAASIDEVLALRPDWRALHRSLTAECWQLFHPEGHVVLHVYAFELMPGDPVTPAHRDMIPRFMLGDPDRSAA